MLANRHDVKGSTQRAFAGSMEPVTSRDTRHGKIVWMIFTSIYFLGALCRLARSNVRSGRSASPRYIIAQNLIGALIEARQIIEDFSHIL